MKYLKYFFIFLFYLSLLFTEDALAQKEVFIAKPGPDGVQRIEILAGGYFFDPNHIIVKVNMPVEIRIKKEAGITPHTFIIKAPEAGIEISEPLDTEPKTSRFTPHKTGKYPFYCDKKLFFEKSHREKGMEGILEVVD